MEIEVMYYDAAARRLLGDDVKVGFRRVQLPLAHVPGAAGLRRAPVWPRPAAARSHFAARLALCLTPCPRR